MQKKKVKKKRIIIHKKHKSKVHAMQTAFYVGMPLAILAFIATMVGITTGCKLPLAKSLEILYSTFGYKIAPIGLLLGPVYVFTDTFLIVWLISKIYNLFIKD